MVTLLDYNECDSRFIAILQFHTGLSHGTQLMLQDLCVRIMY